MSHIAETITLHATHVPKDVFLTLLGALDVEEGEYGKSAESINARNWLLSATKRQETPAPVVSGEGAK